MGAVAIITRLWRRYRSVPATVQVLAVDVPVLIIVLTVVTDLALRRFRAVRIPVIRQAIRVLVEGIMTIGDGVSRKDG
jgi:hypothetical protein